MSKGVALVVGCSGFVGSHVTKALLQRGLSVRGTCRDPGQTRARFEDSWTKNQSLELTEFSLPEDGSPVPEEILDKLVEGVVGVFLCAGHDKQEPATIDFMIDAALSVLKAVRKINSRIPVVMTSTNGKSNLPGAAAGALKNEIEFWSDPAKQNSASQFSPAGETLMEIKALEFFGRNSQNQAVFDSFDFDSFQNHELQK